VRRGDLKFLSVYNRLDKSIQFIGRHILFVEII
jgi:hypothetical protein